MKKSQSASVLVSGVFVALIVLSYAAPSTVRAQPSPTISPSSLDFGGVTVNTSTTDTVFVANTGDAQLSISSLSIVGTDADQFQSVRVISPSSIVVDVGASEAFPIIFRPTSEGIKSATLQLVHNATGSPTSVPLSGAGALMPPVTVAVDTAFGAPGDTLRIPATMTNQTTSPVGGLQLSVIPGDPTAARFVGLEDTTAHPGFTLSAATSGDTTRLVIFSGTGAVIDPGADIPLVTLLYALDPDSADLGSAIPLTFTEVIISDSLGVALADSAVDGQLQVGIRGDVDLDGRITILDIVRVVRIILGKDPTPAGDSVGFKIADITRDGALDILDIIRQVNKILGLAPKRLAAGPSAPVVVSLEEPRTISGGRFGVPVVLERDGVLAGLQARFTFDPTRLEVGTPLLAGEAAALSVDSHVTGGALRVVVYGTTPGQRIAKGDGAVLEIPVGVRAGAVGHPWLTLSDIRLADPQARRVAVRLEEVTVQVGGESTSLPSAFSLRAARPNPFNPNTTIAYEVPQQAHVTLTVYNILGREVVRLVDGMQAPGRYSVTWRGTNAQGAGVASGIYLYRLTSSTGFSKTKRMTLLK